MRSCVAGGGGGSAPCIHGAVVIRPCEVQGRVCSFRCRKHSGLPRHGFPAICFTASAASLPFARFSLCSIYPCDNKQQTVAATHTQDFHADGVTIHHPPHRHLHRNTQHAREQKTARPQKSHQPKIVHHARMQQTQALLVFLPVVRGGEGRARVSLPQHPPGTTFCTAVGCAYKRRLQFRSTTPFKNAKSKQKTHIHVLP